jgi:hypothetical protein
MSFLTRLLVALGIATSPSVVAEGIGTSPSIVPQD